MNDTGTRNAIFILRNICERTIGVNKNLYLCFIDFTKAFDKVRHNKLLNMLQDLDLDGKDIRLVRNLYWDQSAAILLLLSGVVHYQCFDGHGVPLVSVFR